MIDYFTVFNKRGYVLFSQYFSKLKSNPIDALIHDVLLEERGGDNSFSYENYTLKWTFANEFELIFVVVYQKILTLLYMDELLDSAKSSFCEIFKNMSYDGSTLVAIPFEDKFTNILNEVETTAKKRAIIQKKFSDTEKGKDINAKPSPKEEEKKPSKPAKPPAASARATPPASETVEEAVERKKREFAERMNKEKKPAKVAVSTEIKPRVKKPTKWDDVITKQEAAQLERTAPGESGTASKPVSAYIPAEQRHIDLDPESDSDPEDEPAEEPLEEGEIRETPPKKKSSSVGFLKSYFGSLTGNRVLESTDLEPVLVKFKQHLMEKNVATEIADKLCQSVGASLEGKKLTTFQGVSATVKTALEEALTRILTPKRQIDILREVAAVKGQRPYTITFCGVNGVGKSTNLAKVTSWLMQNGLTVMLAACDTFRAGAVEQLGHHASKLGVLLYERGYGKDAAGIAADAISHAKEKRVDVVLIDTAGRMQHNEPLMRSLAKLVNVNKVDLVLFVGEALVGNDGVDQLVSFNKALADLSTTTPPRLVDGIILTKFDTIDDKVGAAISMVYSTGQPIVFLGTGQHYTDLKKMNVGTVIKTLLK